MPVMGAYWLWPARMAVSTASIRAGAQAKSGKPWPRLTAPCWAARADMVVKMVVPTWGRRLCRCRLMVCSKTEIGGLAAHGPLQQIAVQALGQQLGEAVDIVAQIGAALEGDAGDVLAEEMTQRARDQIAAGRVLAHVLCVDT
eukprot:Opistho-2@29247